MKTKPIVQSFSKSIAMDLQQHLGHLVGMPIGCTAPELCHRVDEVILLPWDNFSRWAFHQSYQRMGDAVKALAGYNGYFFDVAVLSKGLSLIKDIRSYLTEMNMEEEQQLIRDSLFWVHNSNQEVDSFSLLSL